MWTGFFVFLSIWTVGKYVVAIVLTLRARKCDLPSIARELTGWWKVSLPQWMSDIFVR